MTQLDIIPCPVCEKEFQRFDLVGHLENVHDWVDADFYQLALLTHRALLDIGGGVVKRLERLEE